MGNPPVFTGAMNRNMIVVAVTLSVTAWKQNSNLSYPN
jgi:hypothetical protein